MSIITLNDASGRSTAQIHAARGFNCFQFEVKHQQNVIPLLWAVDDFAEGGGRPSGSGIPLLFPFPGRLPGTTLQWDGREYPLPQGDGMGNAIHGFVIDRPWRILDQQPDTATGEFQASVDAPELLEQWPADFRIQATYRLSADALQVDFLMENPGSTPLPCGFGTHAYFRLPIGGGQAEECQVAFPVSERWEMEDMIATGRRIPLDEFEDYSSGMAFGSLTLDDVFTGVSFEDGEAEASILDPLSGHRIVLRWDDSCPHCVVYTPPHREAICIEPYTLVPGGLSFQPNGEETGLRVLAAGESCRSSCQIQLQ